MDTLSAKDVKCIATNIIVYHAVVKVPNTYFSFCWGQVKMVILLRSTLHNQF